MININPGELQLLFCPSKALWLLRPTEGGEERGGQGRGEGRNEVNLALFSWLHAVALSPGYTEELFGGALKNSGAQPPSQNL